MVGSTGGAGHPDFCYHPHDFPCWTDISVSAPGGSAAENKATSKSVARKRGCHANSRLKQP